MRKELVQDFGMRVTQATRSELVVIMYEVILKDIEAAKCALDNGQIEAFSDEVAHAGRFLRELMGSLNYEYSLSYRLMSLYIFVNRQLLQAKLHKDGALLDDVVEVIASLLESFREVSALDTSGPVMKNTQQLYAGLTYGRGTLNEMYVNQNEGKRGFIA